MIKLKKIHLSEVSEVDKLTQMEMTHVLGGTAWDIPTVLTTKHVCPNDNIPPITTPYADIPMK